MKQTKVYGKGIFGIRNPFVRPYGISTPTQEDISRRAEGNRRIEEKRAARRQMAPYRRDPAKEKRRQFLLKRKLEDKKRKEERNRLYLEEQKRKNSIFSKMKMPKLPGLNMKRGGKIVTKTKQKPKKCRKTAIKLKKISRTSRNTSTKHKKSGNK